MTNVKKDGVMIKLTPQLIQTEYVEKQKSWGDIAKMLGTNINRVRRFAFKHGFKSRTNAEAQVLALEQGKRPHPTKGTKRSEATKEKISKKVGNAWAEISEHEMKRRKELHRQAMENRSLAERKNMQDRAMKQTRSTKNTGSKLERFIMEKVRGMGLKVDFHRKNLVANQKLEVDMYLPELQVVIEIDGSAHSRPIWGYQKYYKQMRADNMKNGLFMQRNFIVIRVKDTTKTMSDLFMNQMWDKLKPILERVKRKEIERPNLLVVEVK